MKVARATASIPKSPRKSQERKIATNQPDGGAQQKTASMLPTVRYLTPLKLEKGGEDTFLETQFEIKNNRLKYWIKNKNRAGAPAKVWRYSHISCYTPFELKKRTMMATVP